MAFLAAIPFSPMLAAGIEGTIIFIIIAVIAAIYNKLTNRDGSDWDSSNSGSLPPKKVPKSHVPQRTSAKKVDWEEELQRALRDAVPATRQPPPVPRQPPVIPATETLPAMPVPEVFEEKVYKGHCVNCGGHLEFPAHGMGQVIACPFCHAPTVLRPFGDTPVETISHEKHIAAFREAETGINRASQMDERVAAEMAAVTTHRAPTTYVEDFKTRSAEIDDIVKRLRNPRTARQAIIASVVLAPPKAFEG